MSPLTYGPGPGDPAPLQPMPDLAGLPADDVTQRPIGAVVGVLSEAGSGLIRYLDVNLDANGRHVLVPIGHVRIEEHADGTRVRLRAAAREDLDQIPPFDPESADLGNGYESELLIAFSRLFYGEHYYAHPAYDHGRLYAGVHPVVRQGEDTDDEPTLGWLSKLSRWQVARGEPDILGWAVESGTGEPLGTVLDLVIEPAAGRVRYVDLDLPDGERALLPIGFLALEPARRIVRAPALRGEDLVRIPRHHGGTLDRGEERRLLEALASTLHGERRFQAPDFATPPPLS
ncbi:MAG: PRC-barrel domain-containing protein [Longimicrobiales bacterium]